MEDLAHLFQQVFFLLPKLSSQTGKEFLSYCLSLGSLGAMELQKLKSLVQKIYKIDVCDQKISYTRKEVCATFNILFLFKYLYNCLLILSV